MLPSLSGGTDYAVGGAYVTQSISTPLGTIPSVPEQVEEYLSQHGDHADRNALYIIEGGGNDILNASGGSPEELGLRIAEGIAGSELALRRAGAKNFLIPDLLDVGQLPAAQANTTFAAAATSAANRSLDTLLQLEQLLEGINIHRLDVFLLFRQIASDATHFGFTNITTPCHNPTTRAVCADPDHALFWDVQHPTEFGHAFFAVMVEHNYWAGDRNPHLKPVRCALETGPRTLSAAGSVRNNARTLREISLPKIWLIRRIEVDPNC